MGITIKINDKIISEKFPQLSLDLTLYTDQFEDNVNMVKVQSLIEASLYPDRYEYRIKQIAGTSALYCIPAMANFRMPSSVPERWRSAFILPAMRLNWQSDIRDLYFY